MAATYCRGLLAPEAGANAERDNGYRQQGEGRAAAQKANAVQGVTKNEAHLEIDGAGGAPYRAASALQP